MRYKQLISELSEDELKEFAEIYFWDDAELREYLVQRKRESMQVIKGEEKEHIFFEKIVNIIRHKAY